MIDPSTLFTALLLSLGQTLLLLRPSLKAGRTAGLLKGMAGFLALTLTRSFDLTHYFAGAEGPSRYLDMLALLCVMVLIVHAQGDGKAGIGAVIPRTLCFFLFTECSTLALSYVSQNLLGTDIFRMPPLWRQIPAIAALTAAQWVALMFLDRLFPPEICTDASSLWFSLLSSLPYLFCCQITYWLPVDNEQLSPAVPVFLSVSCVLALLLIASMESRLYAEKGKRQALARQHVMELRQQQYVIRKNSMDAVRQNYHDMKNLLLYMQQTGAQRSELREQIDKLLTDIRSYENVLDTGNEAADILLGEKMTVCQQEGIACTVMVDGRLLCAIKPLDLVTIIGNAMDNAIEACRAMPPDAARYIHVRTAERPGFLLLHFSNSCTGESRMENHHFVTLKPDRENHGFGLMNIRRTAESYGGEMACRLEQKEFSLTLLFPLPGPGKAE